MSDSFVQERRHPGTHVTEWTIDRPSRGNGLGPTLIGHFTQRLTQLKASPEPCHGLLVSAAPVVKGARRIWVAGGDLTELAAIDHPDEAYDFALAVSRFLEELATLPIPVVMVIDGEAIGGGAEFALSGDFRIATQASRFDFKQFQMGLCTGFGGARRLIQLVGPTRAESLLYGSQIITASKAKEWGLIHAVVEHPEDLKSQVDQWLSQLRQIPVEVFAAQKKMFYMSRHGDTTGLETRLEAEARLFSSIWKNPTHRQKIREFLGRPRQT